MSKSLTANLKSAPNMKWICVNFSSIHEKYRTEMWVAITFGLWAAAIVVHSFNSYERSDENLFVWIAEILLAFAFAAGFGWHTHKGVVLHRMEKRGELYPSIEEFRTLKL